MILYYNGGEHILVKEYYTYAMYSFIADFGGYLGLLLGASILSFYDDTSTFLSFVKSYFVTKRLKNKIEK